MTTTTIPSTAARARIALLAALALVTNLGLAAAAAPQRAPKPLVRHDPRMYDVRFEVVIAAFPASDSMRALNLRDTIFVLPLVPRGGSSEIDRSTLRPELILDGRPDREVSTRARIEEPKPLDQIWATIPVPAFEGSTMRWSVQWRCQSHEIRVDEGLLASITWPREWPPEVQDALQPQIAIESDADVVGALVTRAVGDNLRRMPPWHAAKEIMRATAISFRSLSGSDTERRGAAQVVGMNMVGAAEALRLGRGTNHDLLAATVAGLRRAGIPARPVIGLADEQARDGTLRSRTALVSWGELFLPGAGWIPFDPSDLRGTAVRQLRVEQAWRGVGTMRDWSRRVTIAHGFMPEGLFGSDYPAVWGYSSGGFINALSVSSSISFVVTSRGRGVADPQ